MTCRLVYVALVVNIYAEVSLENIQICSESTLQIVLGTRTLELVQIVWRHGDRTPVATYPTDPNDPSIWPQGFGQLTERGMRQHQMLGELIRRTYIANATGNLGLKPKYTRNQVLLFACSLQYNSSFTGLRALY